MSLENMGESLETYGDKVESISNQFKDDASEIFEQLAEYIGNDIKEKMSEPFEKVTTGAVAKLDAEVDATATMMEKGADLMKDQIQPLLSQITDAKEKIESMSKEVSSFDIA